MIAFTLQGNLNNCINYGLHNYTNNVLHLVVLLFHDQLEEHWPHNIPCMCYSYCFRDSLSAVSLKINNYCHVVLDCHNNNIYLLAIAQQPKFLLPATRGVWVMIGQASGCDEEGQQASKLVTRPYDLGAFDHASCNYIGTLLFKLCKPF